MFSGDGIALPDAAPTEGAAMFYDALATAIESAGRNQLDDFARQIWRGYGAGVFTDAQAQQLGEQIQQRRQRYTPRLLIIGSTSPRYTIQRSPEQRSPDRRASLTRRREHAATGPLPPGLAATFTTGELAVLKVVSDEFLAHGACDRSVNELAARAGVCRSIVKQAVKYAERDGLITVQHRPRSGRKHLTNILRIVRAEWLDWLAKGRRKAYAVNACRRAKPDFHQARGLENNPPRSQRFRKSDRGAVNNSVEKRNRTGASRA